MFSIATPERAVHGQVGHYPIGRSGGIGAAYTIDQAELRDVGACRRPISRWFGRRALARALARLREAVDGFEKLLRLLSCGVFVAGGERAGDAVLDVLVEDPEGEAFEGG